MIRRPPRSTHCISSAASDVYKRQTKNAKIISTPISKDKLLNETNKAQTHSKKNKTNPQLSDVRKDKLFKNLKVGKIIKLKRTLDMLRQKQKLTTCTFTLSVTPCSLNRPLNDLQHSLRDSENIDSNALKFRKEQKGKSIFDHDTFELFTLEKYGDKLTTDNLSRILSMKEKLILYKEKTERKYLNKMYKSRQYSPQTYYRKRKELEKWVTKEKADISQTKSGISSSCHRIVAVSYTHLTLPTICSV
eukprot:TRINITY_DN23241_c0_g1_i3.p1 TRINITY_DN23241_c0_g1~~TRINITY_DN23241_c0_g1_i3.p1  ORF type:complete len:255 (+),score=64.54 TRINITY_DN23241_c0_g1_i3:25-765(+)